MMRFMFILLAVVLIGSSLMSMRITPGAFAGKDTKVPLQACTVIRLYDGDTLACDLNGNRRVDGQEEHVRLLSIDAPEMSYSKKNHTGKDAPWAKQAKNRVYTLTYHKKVYLEPDKRTFDKYNRRLAYVYLDPKGQQMLNLMLVKEGLARVWVIPPNRHYQAAFEAAQYQAQKARRAIWNKNEALSD